MMPRRDTLFVVLAGFALLIFALLFARLGFFIIDEAIYMYAADSFRLTGGYALNNGSSLARSSDLLWTNLLSEGPEGVTSQYPPGTAWTWAPLLTHFGERAVIMLHAVAAFGTLWATKALAVRLFGSAQVALLALVLLLFGTFMLEYAFVYWPHMISVFTATLSLVFFVDALAGRGRSWRPAFASGFVLGIGLLFRFDTVLLLPAFAILAILFAVAPVRLLIGGVVGVTPAFLALAWVNGQKFGTFNPLTYGGKGGFTELSAYVPLIILGVVGLGFLALVRSSPSARIWPILAGLAAVIVGGALAISPQAQAVFQTLGRGAFILLIDARDPVDPLSGIIAQPDGTTLYWGLAKKALLQSAPWLGVLILALRPAFWRGRVQPGAISVVTIGIFVMPFAATAWHGGMSSNMRYFLPIMPVLAVLSAALLSDLSDRVPGAMKLGVFAAVAGVGASIIWTMLMPTGLAGAHQLWSLYLGLVVALVCLSGVFVLGRGVAVATHLVVCVGLGTAMFNTLSDTAISQLRRANSETLTDLSQSYEGRIIIFDQLLRSAMLNPEQVVALRSHGAPGPDPGLVASALADGYRVFMPDATALGFTERHAGYVWQDVTGPLDLAEVQKTP